MNRAQKRQSERAQKDMQIKEKIAKDLEKQLKTVQKVKK